MLVLRMCSPSLDNPCAGGWPHTKSNGEVACTVPKHGLVLAVVTLCKTILSFIRLYLDCVVAKAWQSENFLWFYHQVKVKVLLRPVLSVCLGVRHPSGAHDQLFIIIRQLLVSWCGIPSEMRVGLWFTIATGHHQCSHSQVQVHKTHPYFTVSYLRLPQPGRPGSRIYIL
jgi:hypothetical protein